MIENIQQTAILIFILSIIAIYFLGGDYVDDFIHRFVLFSFIASFAVIILSTLVRIWI